MYYKVNILDIPIANVSQDETILEIEKFVVNNSYNDIFPTNVDMIVKSINDNSFKKVLKNAQLLVPDGMPLVWASKLLKRPLKEKVSGSNLFLRICELSAKKGYRLFFLGAAEGVAAKAAEIISAKYKGLNIVGTYSPSIGFENDIYEIKKIISLIKESKTDVLFVAFGAPKQEKWICKYKDEYKVPVSIAVGATFDYIVGLKKMPPQFLKKLGFAWLWRLCDEPKRLWRRYLIDDMKFFYYILQQKLGLKDFNK